MFLSMSFKILSAIQLVNATKGLSHRVKHLESIHPSSKCFTQSNWTFVVAEVIWRPNAYFQQLCKLRNYGRISNDLLNVIRQVIDIMWQSPYLALLTISTNRTIVYKFFLHAIPDYFTKQSDLPSNTASRWVKHFDKVHNWIPKFSSKRLSLSHQKGDTVAKCWYRWVAHFG